MKRMKFLLFSLTDIDYRYRKKTSTQSYSAGINQRKCVRLFDGLSRHQDQNLEYLKICNVAFASMDVEKKKFKYPRNIAKCLSRFRLSLFLE